MQLVYMTMLGIIKSYFSIITTIELRDISQMHPIMSFWLLLLFTLLVCTNLVLQ